MSVKEKICQDFENPKMMKTNLPVNKLVLPKLVH